MKDAVATMGMILPDDVGGRDAVHVAVISAQAAEPLERGQSVICTQVGGEDVVAHPCRSVPPIGIVDPFLKESVQPGDRFWLYLMPRTITSLRHNWTHPQFEEVQDNYHTPADKLRAEQWLRNFCETNDCPEYETMVDILTQFANGTTDGKLRDTRDPEGYDDYYGWHIEPEYFHFGGRDAHGEIPTEFWMNAEIVVGKRFKFTPHYFSCSC